MKALIEVRVTEDLKTALFMGVEFPIYTDTAGYYILIYKFDGTPTMHYLNL